MGLPSPDIWKRGVIWQATATRRDSGPRGQKENHQSEDPPCGSLEIEGLPRVQRRYEDTDRLINHSGSIQIIVCGAVGPRRLSLCKLLLDGGVQGTDGTMHVLKS